jgi:FlaA1/EpsC-like NDP-sugar epimerase
VRATTFRDRLRTRRLFWLMAYDGAAWAAALVVFGVLRVQLQLETIREPVLLLTVAACWLLQGSLGWVLRLYHGRARLASLEEMLLLGWVTATVGGVVFLANAWAYPDGLPRSVPLGGTFLALVLMSWGRALWRRGKDASGRVVNPDAEPALVFGAGDAGLQLVRSMQHDSASPWKPVGLLDDDRWKRHLRIEGVPVLGSRERLGSVAAQTGATTLVIAIPTAGAKLVRDVTTSAREAGLTVKVLPPMTELIDQRVGIGDIRDIDVADVLGRRQIETDLESIAGYLTGKRVLVTGAGGSIGSELCRQIHRWGPAELIMLDRDESALHAVQLSIHGRAMLDSSDVVLADIRDTAHINRLFEARRPQIVFHAAALKHLPMLEQYPGEAVKTNVWGTLTVLEAAKAFDVDKFINISTDKAANPTSVLGYSKRIAEGLTATLAAASAGTYLSVRFGNVLGSRGSVLTTFASQIAAGGPVTVTHPEVTRYFMTVQEAVQLVIQAAAIGGSGEVLILDMGEPVRIDEVARRLIDMSGRPVNVNYTGLREGEKLHEELFASSEYGERRVHPLISHVQVPPVSTTRVREIDVSAGRKQVAAQIEQCSMAVGVAFAYVSGEALSQGSQPVGDR